MAPALRPLATDLRDDTALFQVSISACQAMTATVLKPFVFGMGANETVRCIAGDDFLVGDCFDQMLLNGLLNNVRPLPPTFDAAMVGHDGLPADDGDDTLLADLGYDVIMICNLSFGSDSIPNGAGWDMDYVPAQWGLGLASTSTARLVVGTAAGIEVIDFAMHYLDETAEDDLFHLGGLAQIWILVLASAAIRLMAGNDSFTGTQSGVWVDGGADLLVVGAHHDTYVVDFVREVTVKVAGGGTDTVSAVGPNFTRGARINALQVTGIGGFNGTG